MSSSEVAATSCAAGRACAGVPALALHVLHCLAPKTQDRRWHAGDGHVDLQLRMVPAMALDPDGVNAYVAIGKLAEQGKSWPTGYTLQLLAVRARHALLLLTLDPGLSAVRP